MRNSWLNWLLKYRPIISGWAVKAFIAYLLFLGGFAYCQERDPAVAKGEIHSNRKVVEYGVKSIPVWPRAMDIDEQYPAIVPDNITSLLEKFRSNLDQHSQKYYMRILYLESPIDGGHSPKGKWLGVFLGIEVVSKSGKKARYMYSFDKDEELFFKEMLGDLQTRDKEPAVKERSE